MSTKTDPANNHWDCTLTKQLAKGIPLNPSTQHSRIYLSGIVSITGDPNAQVQHAINNLLLEFGLEHSFECV